MADSAYFGAHGYDLCDVRLFHYLIRRPVPTLETGRAIFISTGIPAVWCTSDLFGRWPADITQKLNSSMPPFWCIGWMRLPSFVVSFSTLLSDPFFLVQIYRSLFLGDRGGIALILSGLCNHPPSSGWVLSGKSNPASIYYVPWTASLPGRKSLSALTLWFPISPLPSLLSNKN